MAFNNNEAIGTLVLNYNANEQCLAALHNSIHTIGKQVSELGRMLTEYPETIEVRKTDFILANGQAAVPHDVTGNLVDLLGNLGNVIKEKERMEGCLQQAGLGRFIQKATDG